MKTQGRRESENIGQGEMPGLYTRFLPWGLRAIPVPSLGVPAEPIPERFGSPRHEMNTRDLLEALRGPTTYNALMRR